jgi:hypothetical protein
MYTANVLVAVQWVRLSQWAQRHSCCCTMVSRSLSDRSKYNGLSMNIATSSLRQIILFIYFTCDYNPIQTFCKAKILKINIRNPRGSEHNPLLYGL